VEPATLSPSLDGLRRVFAAGARVAVVSPLYGMPFDSEALVRELITLPTHSRLLCAERDQLAGLLHPGARAEGRT
jgi:hypothetical protein